MKLRFLMPFFILVLIFSLFFSMGVMASPNYSNVYPSDDATNIWVNIPQLKVSINSSDGSLMTGTITFINTGQVTTLTSVTNGTFYLNLSSPTLPLNSTETYEWRVHVRNTSHTDWTNTSYNFTTGTPARMREYNAFDSNEIILINLIGIVVTLGFIVTMYDMLHTGKLDPNKLIFIFFAVIILGALLAFL